MNLAERLRAQADKKAKKREGKKSPGTVPETPILEAPSTVKHTIRTQDLLRQAEIVSQNRKIKVPDAIIHVVKRAVNARKRCAEWFVQTGIDNGRSNAGHEHFIEILEKAMTILQSESSTSDTKKSRDPTAGTQSVPSKPTTKPLQDLSGLSNRFSNLEVEDTEDIVETESNIQTVSPANISQKTAPKSAQTKAIDVFQLEHDDAYDRNFGIFCFFEDLHRIQDFLNDTWKKYKAGELDLITASLVTNAALDIVRREEEEVMKSAFPRETGLDYLQLSICIFFADSLTSPRGISSKAALSEDNELRITPFDNFIYLPTARTLMKWQPFVQESIQVRSVSNIKILWLC